MKYISLVAAALCIAPIAAAKPPVKNKAPVAAPAPVIAPITSTDPYGDFSTFILGGGCGAEAQTTINIRPINGVGRMIVMFGYHSQLVAHIVTLDAASMAVDTASLPTCTQTTTATLGHRLDDKMINGQPVYINVPDMKTVSASGYLPIPASVEFDMAFTTIGLFNGATYSEPRDTKAPLPALTPLG